MSYVTILWSMVAAAALLLGGIHLLGWSNDRPSRASLAFACLALSLAAVALAELGMMQAQGPGEWGWWVRWYHVPLFFLIAGTFVFIRLHLNAGRWSLIAVIVALRCVILVVNFAVDPNFNFARIDSIDHVPFLGERVTVVGDSVPGAWQWLATATGLLYVVFLLDAFVAVWRRGTRDDRRSTFLIGGGLAAFVVLAFTNTQLVIWGVVRMPMLVTPAFFIPLLAMGYELSREALHGERLARDLAESERGLDLAAAAAGLGLCVWNADGRVSATDRAREMFGFTRRESIDLDRLAARVHADDLEALRNSLKSALQLKGDWSAEFRVRKADGTDRWILAHGRSEAGSRDSRRSLRGVLRDITDQKHAEADADELRRELTHIGRVTTLGQLASSLAHELSQPLGAILRNAEAAELLLQQPSPDIDELRAIVTDIHRDDRRAGDVIERLRALLQRRQLNLEPIVVEDLVRDVSALVRPDATARHILLRCEPDAGLPQVYGDRVHLSQVLLNLLINALDATTEAKRTGPVVVEAHGSSGFIDVVVTDGGAGIPPESLDLVFEPFYTTKSTGLGMGLAVSRTIVTAHGGRLWAENVAHGGAQFHLVLPVAPGIAS